MRDEAGPYRPDLFEHFGTVHLQRMFGGRGLFAGDVMIGLVAADDTIFLKTDEETRAAFVAEGSRAFAFKSKRARGAIATSYYEVPERLYDEPEAFAEWVRRAYAIAERSPSVQKKRQILKKAVKPRRAKAVADRSPTAQRKRKKKLSSPAEHSPKARARGPR